MGEIIWNDIWYDTLFYIFWICFKIIQFLKGGERARNGQVLIAWKLGDGSLSMHYIVFSVFRVCLKITIKDVYFTKTETWPSGAPERLAPPGCDAAALTPAFPFWSGIRGRS